MGTGSSQPATPVASTEPQPSDVTPLAPRQLSAAEQQRLAQEVARLRDQLGPENYRPGRLRNVPNVPSTLNRVRIAIVGQTGSGKSCLVSTTHRAVSLPYVADGDQEPTWYPAVGESSSGGEGTVLTEEVLMGPRASASSYSSSYLDTRGFFSNNPLEFAEFVAIVDGRLRHGDTADRGDVGTPLPCFPTGLPPSSWSADDILDRGVTCEAPLADRVHGVIVVVKANDPRLASGTYDGALERPRRVLGGLGIAPVCVVTHEDTLRTQAERDRALHLASACTGSSVEDTYLITNYTARMRARSVLTDWEALTVLHKALEMAERHIDIYLSRQAASMFPYQLATKEARPQPPTGTKGTVTVHRGDQKANYRLTDATTLADLFTNAKNRWKDLTGQNFFGDQEGAEYPMFELVLNLPRDIYLY
ncbi:E3 ubiquitin-protein ligase TRIM56 [Pelomyxa schiedti]|nr:E3 ubiquitin-protein ligase TRIM56 [Pelomyxa schiedti]